MSAPTIIQFEIVQTTGDNRQPFSYVCHKILLIWRDGTERYRLTYRCKYRWHKFKKFDDDQQYDNMTIVVKTHLQEWANGWQDFSTWHFEMPVQTKEPTGAVVQEWLKLACVDHSTRSLQWLELLLKGQINVKTQ